MTSTRTRKPLPNFILSAEQRARVSRVAGQIKDRAHAIEEMKRVDAQFVAARKILGTAAAKRTCDMMFSGAKVLAAAAAERGWRVLPKKMSTDGWVVYPGDE